MPSKLHRKYPYLLRGKNIWLPNQALAADITYLKLARGHVYLVAIIDVYSRKILSAQVSNTLDAEFCVAALEAAIVIYGVPAIFNTDQCCQFTSEAFAATFDGHGIRISMYGVNRALDNIYIERFWRTLKYEDLYLNDYRTLTELKAGIKRYMGLYDRERFHASHDYLTPDHMYARKIQQIEPCFVLLHRNKRAVDSTLFSLRICVDRRVQPNPLQGLRVS